MFFSLFSCRVWFFADCSPACKHQAAIGIELMNEPPVAPPLSPDLYLLYKVGVLLRKCLLLHPATPYYPSPRGKSHTRGNIGSCTVG